jgi:hypothetical protein
MRDYHHNELKNLAAIIWFFSLGSLVLLPMPANWSCADSFPPCGFMGLLGELGKVWLYVAALGCLEVNYRIIPAQPGSLSAQLPRRAYFLRGAWLCGSGGLCVALLQRQADGCGRRKTAFDFPEI